MVELDQWDFVESTSSPPSPDSVAAALRRISAWRSRGSLPIPIDVTAAFVEAQQKDPFFRKGPVDDALTSEEMLASLYSMAIMSLKHLISFGAGPMQHSENPDNGDSRFLAISNNTLKTIITKLSSKEPRLLLSLLKVVLEKIEAIESLRSKNDSVSMLLDMIEDDTQKEKLKKLILLRLQNWPTEDPMLLKEDDSIKKAAEKLEFLKQRLEKRSSTAVLPILDLVDDNRLEEKTIPTDDLQLVDNHHDNDGGDSDSHDEPLLSNGRAAKKLRPSPEKVHIFNLRQSPDPIEGRLLINGAWVKVSKEELVSIATTLRSGV
uniref:Uncharacterized protein n=1 Tax=Ananas comosus var. bracteatus TaxID=296719 RepID=A0A6V7PFA9_ANACO|nr:unnamed protein product [Ananas comosus var. bracteatus]